LAVVGDFDGEAGGFGGGGCGSRGAVVGLREVVQEDGRRHFGNQENVGDVRRRIPIGIAGLGSHDGDLAGPGEGQVGAVGELRGAGGDGKGDIQPRIGGGGQADGIGDPLVAEDGKIDGLVGRRDDERAVGGALPIGLDDGARDGVGARVGGRRALAVVGDFDGEAGGFGGGGCGSRGAVVGLREVVQEDGRRQLEHREDVGDGRGGSPIVVAGLGGDDGDLAGADEGQVGAVGELRGAGGDEKFDAQSRAGGGGQADGVGDPLIGEGREVDGLRREVAGAREQHVGQRRNGIAGDGQRRVVDAAGRRREDDREIGCAAHGDGGRDAGNLEVRGVRAVGGPAEDRQVGSAEVAQREHVGGRLAPGHAAEIGAFCAAGRFGIRDGDAVGAQQRQPRRRAQDERARLAVVAAVADDFVEFVDADGVGEHPAGFRRNQRIEIGHGAVAPEKGLVGAGRRGGIAHDPRPVVDAVGVGIVGEPVERAQILHEGIGGIGMVVGP